MKRHLLSGLLIAAAGSGSLMAHNTEVPLSESFRKEVATVVHFPKSLEDESASLKALVEVSSDGTVEVKQINSSHSEMVAELKKEIESIKLENTSGEFRTWIFV